MYKLPQSRNSRMEIGEVYFWTSTIHQWKHLLKPNKYKQFIIDSLINLISKRKIKVYGHVIMPNHIHLLWEMLELNGKEMPHASFQKFTAHEFQKDLKEKHPEVLKKFLVEEKERKYRFWQRDPLAVIVTDRKMAEQKLDYIHLNPLQTHWNLTERPEEYQFSSAQFYETGKDDFGFLTHYKERF